jgi:hypothetical protein
MPDEVVRVPTEKNRGGIWVRIGDEEYRVAALGFRALQDLAEDVATLQNMGQMPTREQMEVVIRIVHAAMLRNYPSMSMETVADMLDLANFEKILNAVMNITGYVKGNESSGEMVASTGTGSTSP